MKHIIIAIVDSAEVTEVNILNVISTERSKRWARFIDSACTQTKKADVIVYCPTEEGKYWDDMKCIIKERVEELKDTILIFGPTLRNSNELHVIRKATEMVEEKIGAETLNQSWISLFLYPTTLHNDFNKCVHDYIVETQTELEKSGTEPQVIVLNKKLANNRLDLGHIHETVIIGKIVKAFFKVSDIH